MSIDAETVNRIAQLARISTTAEEAEALVGELNTILDWVAQLDEVDTSGVVPMTSVVESAMKMRDDVVTDGNCRDAILANAPNTEDGYFVVPKVVE